LLVEAGKDHPNATVYVACIETEAELVLHQTLMKDCGMPRFEKAKPEDAKTLALVSGRAFDNDVHYGAPGKGGPPGYKSDMWQIRMMARSHYYKILLDDNCTHLIGGFIVFQNAFGDCELGRIFIDPEYQNQGIGTQAMAFMDHAFPEARRWTLGTPLWNLRTQHFYEKVGYVKIGMEGSDGVRYEKRMANQGEASGI
jgi:RimJ/RimL family protein N-acetyltransferase